MSRISHLSASMWTFSSVIVRPLLLESWMPPPFHFTAVLYWFLNLIGCNAPRSSYSSLTIQIISNLTNLDLVQAKFCTLTLKGCKTPEIQNHQSRTTNNQGQQTNSSKVVMWWVVPYCVVQLQNSSKLQTEPTEIKGWQTTSAIKINSDCQLLTWEIDMWGRYSSRV